MFLWDSRGLGRGLSADSIDDRSRFFTYFWSVYTPSTFVSVALFEAHQSEDYVCLVVHEKQKEKNAKPIKPLKCLMRLRLTKSQYPIFQGNMPTYSKMYICIYDPPNRHRTSAYTGKNTHS